MVVPLETKQTDTKKREGKICWGGSLEGIDCGDEVAEWLSWNLDRPGLRLIKCTDRHAVPKQYGKLISHANFIYYSKRFKSNNYTRQSKYYVRLGHRLI